MENDVPAKKLIQKLMFCGIAEFIILGVALFLNFKGITLYAQLVWFVPAIVLCGIVTALIILKQVLVQRKSESNKASEDYQKKSALGDNTKI